MVHLPLPVTITTQFITTLYPRFKVVRLTIIVVSITKFNNHYHVVISKILNITLFCSDVHYTIFTVQTVSKVLTFSDNMLCFRIDDFSGSIY